MKPDLVLLDILMPGISGIGDLEFIRTRYGAIELPVIMVTAKEDDHDIVRAFELGANDYIQKPLKPEVALSRITTQLNLKDLYGEHLQLVEADSIRAMITTYNHEPNGPLTVALTLTEKTEISFKDQFKIHECLRKIEAILKKIDTVVDEKIEFSEYAGNQKMLKVSGE